MPKEDDKEKEQQDRLEKLVNPTNNPEFSRTRRIWWSPAKQGRNEEKISEIKRIQAENAQAAKVLELFNEIPAILAKKQPAEQKKSLIDDVTETEAFVSEQTQKINEVINDLKDLESQVEAEIEPSEAETESLRELEKNIDKIKKMNQTFENLARELPKITDAERGLTEPLREVLPELKEKAINLAKNAAPLKEQLKTVGIHTLKICIDFLAEATKCLKHCTTFASYLANKISTIGQKPIDKSKNENPESNMTQSAKELRSASDLAIKVTGKTTAFALKGAGGILGIAIDVLESFSKQLQNRLDQRASSRPTLR